MKETLLARSKNIYWYLSLIVGIFLGTIRVHAGLTVDIHLYHDSIGYYFFPYLSTNTTPPDYPVGDYLVASPQVPASGSTLLFHATATSFQECINDECGGGTYYNTFDSFLDGITNGFWSIWVTNGITTQYKFKVTATGFTSNSFGANAIITFPINNQVSVPNAPTFTWIGPVNWAGTINVQDNSVDTNGNYSYVDSSPLTPSATNWTPSVSLPNGTNNFSVSYSSNLTATLIASTPTNNAGQAISGWVSSSSMETSPSILFVAGLSANPFEAYLVARYDFEITNSPGIDSSGNGNDSNCGSGNGSPTNNDIFSTNAAIGSFAREYFGNNAFCFFPNGADCYNNISNALYGSFSLSAWVNTTNLINDDFANAYFGSPIFFDYNSNTNSAILSITGSKAAFTISNPDGTDTVLHSTTSVNDGHYHFIAVTRDQTNGLMSLYVDGRLEATDTSTSGSVIATATMSVAGGDAGFYFGLLDDVRIYSTELSAADVAILYGHPPDNGLVVHYDFDQDTVLAADVSGNNNDIVYSGDFDGNGSSISSYTVAGAGSISFDGGSYLTASSNLLSTLAGEFSISLWLKTGQSFGNQGDFAWEGAGVISADSPNGDAKDLIPIALTDGQVAFNIGDGDFDNTLNSDATVNNDFWHHVVVTRSLATGARQIFIDGMLDSSDVASTLLLDSPVLLTIGAKSDASDPDPTSPDANGSNGYEGLLDDIQIYNRVLSSGEVAFLFQNPGATLASATNTPYPVDVSLHFDFIRSQDPNYGDIYGASVFFNSVSPAPTTTNSVHSPHDYYNTQQYPGGGSGGGAILFSLNDVVNEFTNGFWKIYINQGSPTQQVYSFQVSISDLNTNLLKAVKVFSPTNGALDVAASPTFYWVGPSNFTTLQVDLLSGPVASLPINATNWTSAPKLNYGPDRFDVGYTSNNFPGVTFSTPVDASSNSVRTWTTTVDLSSQSFNNFVVGPNQPQLIHPQQTGTNFQFSFLSQTGVTNSLQYRTNLTEGLNWQTYSNVIGDGSLKTISIPFSLFSPAKQGFVRIQAQ